MADSKTFKEIIKEYLDGRAAEDPLFAANYAKEKKNIDECCKYIIGEAQKVKNGNCAVMTDEAVYGLAVHYYDEDDIVVDKKPVAAKVTTAVAPKPEKPKVEEPKKPEAKQLSIFDFL